jgi:uncharacterized protein (DUF362 family)
MLSTDAIKRNSRRKYLSVKFSIFFIGLTALIWFMLRVIPKPSRSSYPCQRAAFPIASAFVIWVAGTIFSHSIYKKAKIAFGTGNHSKALVCVFLAIIVFTLSVFVIQIKDNVYAAINFATISQNGEMLYASEMAAIADNIIEPKATVAIVRSEKANATEVTFADINTMIRQAVVMAGGFDTLIHEGDLVVIKPNVIAGRAQNASFSNSFPDSANGIATDYRIIQVVVNMVRENNSTGKIIMIEGSGYGLTRKNIEAIGYTKITGLDSIICLEENITKWYDTNSANLVKVSLPAGKNLYSSANNKYYLHKIYHDADVLISLPCLKSHFLTGITGSVKNVGIGATPVEMYGNGTSVAEDDIPGRWNHIQHGDFSTQTISLDKWIHDFYMCRPVDYVIMDGIQGADYGPYPGSNTYHTLSSVQKNLRVILAGKDPLAVDAIESLIAGIDPYLVGHLVLLANDTVGCINPSFIKVKGTQVYEIKTPFGEDNPGKKCKYNDFTGPYNVTLTNCTVNNSEINVSLVTSDDIVKVEIAYNDTILDPMVVSNFSDITIPFNKENGDTSMVSVLLYDKYLNSTRLTLEDNSRIMTIDNQHKNSFKVYPNPASTILNFDLPVHQVNNYKLTLISIDGKIILHKEQTGIDKQQLDIFKLKKGLYYLKISFNGNDYQARFNKI